MLGQTRRPVTKTTAESGGNDAIDHGGGRVLLLRPLLSFSFELPTPNS